MLSLPCAYRVLVLVAFLLSSYLDSSSCECSSTDYKCLNETSMASECSAHQLCSRYDPLTNNSCGENLQLLQSNVTVIKPHTSVYMFSNTTSYSGRVIQICDGHDVEELSFESGRFCDTTIDLTNNQITFEGCEDGGISLNGSGIALRNCSSLNCTIVYIIEYINCTTYCAKMADGDASDGDASGGDYLWDECSEVNVSEAQAVSDKECQRQKCWKFFKRSCYLCPENCSEVSSHNQRVSDHCPSHFLSNCTEEYCQPQCKSMCFDCNGENRSLCEDLCDRPFQNISFPDAGMISTEEITKIRRFCADRIQRNCSNLTLSEMNCENSTYECIHICRRIGVAGYFARGCPNEVYEFCEDFIDDLLESESFLTEDSFTTFVDVVSAFLEDVPPSELVEVLESLVEELIDESLTDVLVNDSNVELLAELYDDLFDDDISVDWFNDSSTMNTESTVLSQMESLGELLSTNTLEGNRSSPFRFKGDNLFMSIKPPNRLNAVDDKHRVTIQGESNLNGFRAEIRIPLSVLCRKNDTEECSSVVAVSVVNNLASYLHRALIMNQSNSNKSSEYSQFTPVTEILSAQVIGVPNLEKMLTNSPVVISMNISMRNLTDDQIKTSVCVFWNHSESSWSNKGVDTFNKLASNQVRCVSRHLTSFAVLVSLNPNPGNSTADVALTAISYIGCVISIVCLLATIICLILFRKLLNKGPLLYVHLNLAIALLLGYFFFVVGVETARQIEALCIVLAAVMQYFFLASFFWMLSEGIMLYLLVVRVFGNAAQRWYWLLLVGWGLPLPIIVISAGVLQSDYISDNYCWLRTGLSSAAIWTFVVPMLLVILVNSVILVMTVVSVVRGKKYGGAGTEVKTRTLVITGIQGAVILLPLLGITWVIGLFQVNDDTVVFAWIFVFLNSFQGVFIFALHVLRNSALLNFIKLKCCKKEKTIEVTNVMMLSSKRISSLDHAGTSRPFSPSFSSTKSSSVDYADTSRPFSPLVPLNPEILEKKDELLLLEEVKGDSLGLLNSPICTKPT